MIISRITQAIKDQNWSTITVEILVVIVGILIGLQVDDLNNTRLDRAEARYYTNRLIQELDETLDLISAEVDLAGQVLTATAEAATMIRKGAITEDNRQYFEENFSQAFYLPDYRFPVRALSDLRATGRLAIFEDDAVREQLVQYEEFSSFGETQFRVVLDQFSREAVQLAKMVDLPSDYRISRSIISPNDTLNNNVQLARMLIVIHLLQNTQRRNLEQFMKATQELRDSLAATVSS